MAAGSSSSSIKAKGKGKAPSVPASPSPAAVTATSTSTSISTTSKTGSSSDTVQEISSSTSASSCSCSEFPEIQVNKWSLHELKQGCDDALKQYLSQPAQFTPSHVHTDVRLLLGWSSSLIALGAAGWAWKVNSKFQETRGMLLAAVVAFALLQAAAGAYAKWVEGDTVFVGRRKVFAGRIETQTLTIRSSCEPYVPIYGLRISYSHTTNAGKSVISRVEREVKKPFGEMYDNQGRLRRAELEKVLEGVLAEAQRAP